MGSTTKMKNSICKKRKKKKKGPGGPSPFGPPPGSVPALTLNLVIQPPKYIHTHTLLSIYLSIYLFFFFFLNNKYFNTHTGREKNILKKLTVVYIQKSITLGYIIQTLNIFIYLSIYTSINNRIICLSFIILRTKISLHKI